MSIDSYFKPIKKKDKDPIILDSNSHIIFYNYIDPDLNDDDLFDELYTNIPWIQPIVKMFGKTMYPKRQVCTMGKPYNYNGNNSNEITPIPEIIKKIMNQINDITGEDYNTCIANYYVNGEAYICMHDDGEKSSESIASVSFGASRKFVIENKKNKDKYELLLHNNSIIVMKGSDFQKNWKHGIPIEKKIKQPRISLTFRTY